ncbi:PAS domain S-box-containing protein [Malonomonas rubra DSM 5091]|uniref:histidine kinase n=1 Tax=Malonomonas rubra DSM 5091 TaxID=1122189 RepID=A0A1M6N024_MALRU|nr:PAS domain S-box protein [Malonomonas rubra]SHJ88953.1 PAS domain S-box-containing protein [Malonomonas rubra DSM 5091]
MVPTDHPAYQSMTVSFLEGLLQKVNQTDQFPEFAAQEFLEISGAKTAVLIQEEAHQHRILATIPQRRATMTEQPAFWALVDEMHNHHQIQIWSPEEESPAAAHLNELNAGLSMAVPFETSGKRAGGLLLFGLPELEHVVSLRHIFTAMSQVIALALRSALLFETQELLLESNSLELKKQRESLQAFFDNKLVGMVHKDADNRYLSVNQRWQDMLGYDQEELVGRCADEFIVAEDLEQHRLSIRQLALKVEPTQKCSTRYRRKDGSAFWGAVSASALYDENDNFTGILALIVDETEQRQARLKLQESEKKYRFLLNNLKDAVFLHRFEQDQLGPFVEINSVATERYGYSRDEFLQMTPSDLNAEGRVDSKAPRVYQDQKEYTFEVTHRKKNGETFPVEINAALIALEGEKYILATVRDISERKEAEAEKEKLEEQLRQKYKMEAVGVMAGGMAHNFNNNLSIIMGNIELALLKLDDPQELKPMLEYAKTAVLRSRDLIKQIMLYSRQGQSSKKPISISLIVEETLNLLRSTIPTTIDIDYQVDVDGKTAIIKADPTRIQEALINLCTNAVHAMDESGQLSIAIFTKTLWANDIPAQYQCAPGRYVCLRVKDTGCGMSKEVKEKIFDPFFTTKAVDQGTGMGLSTVQGVVDQLQGLIKVESAPGSGTSFELFFPLAGATDSETAETENKTIPTGSERILFVDDEEMLAELGKEILSYAGYEVSCTTDSRQALAQIKENPHSFDLLVTDQTMPGLTGKELIEQARRIRPELPVILCTGYSSKVNEQELKKAGFDAFCMKPLEMENLLQAVGKALNKC